jgi:hypothetical protein
MPDYQSFVDKLIAKTASGRIMWKPTIESDAFTAAIENEFTLRVSQPVKEEFAFEMRDQRGNKLVNLSANKAQAWEQGYEEAVEHYERLRQLFETARSTALDVSTQLSRAESLLDRY